MKKNNFFDKVLLITLLSSVSGHTGVKAKDVTSTPINAIEKRHSIGSSFFVLANFLTDSPDFYQLSYSYNVMQKDNIIVEAITWKYNEPLGSYGNSKEFYLGKIRAYGIGLGYQHFLWNNLFTTVEVTPFIQQFYDENNKKIQKGFQLYLQCILGYRFEFFKKKLFIEPAIAFKHWPINTNYPDSFKKVEKGSPNYIFEPSFNFGIKF